MADPVQMRQLFQNLIDNAIKFRQLNQPSKVRIFLEDGLEKTAYGTGLCHITVEDNGIGFESQYAEQIFGMFKRLQQTAEDVEGTGMGLALCRNIIKRHGGTIYAQSHVGVGCRFRITLPKTQKGEN
jgi:two-component system sensor kinase FixL